MGKTRKNSSSQGIEMQEIPFAKRLGRKDVITNDSNSSLRSSRSLRFNRSKKIYRERVKRSICRGKKREVCIRSCKYTKGQIRKYCRKKKNEVVRF
jgi:hypothetical protein